jgi:hypothetical protein
VAYGNASTRRSPSAPPSEVCNEVGTYFASGLGCRRRRLLLQRARRALGWA